MKERKRTFEKWYPSGTEMLKVNVPSLDEPPLTTIVCESAPERRLRRFKDLDLSGGCTPFNSRVRTSTSELFRSKYLITLLFVSAMYNLPEKDNIEQSQTQVSAVTFSKMNIEIHTITIS